MHHIGHLSRKFPLSLPLYINLSSQ